MAYVDEIDESAHYLGEHYSLQVLLEESAVGGTKHFSLSGPDTALVGSEARFTLTSFGITANLLKVSAQVSHGEIAEVVYCPLSLQATRKKKSNISINIVVAIKDVGDCTLHVKLGTIEVAQRTFKCAKPGSFYLLKNFLSYFKHLFMLLESIQFVNQPRLSKCSSSNLVVKMEGGVKQHTFVINPIATVEINPQQFTLNPNEQISIVMSPTEKAPDSISVSIKPTSQKTSCATITINLDVYDQGIEFVNNTARPIVIAGDFNNFDATIDPIICFPNTMQFILTPPMQVTWLYSVDGEIARSKRQNIYQDHKSSFANIQHGIRFVEEIDVEFPTPVLQLQEEPTYSPPSISMQEPDATLVGLDRIEFMMKQMITEMRHMITEMRHMRTDMRHMRTDMRLMRTDMARMDTKLNHVAELLSSGEVVVKNSFL